jgi:N-acetylneuraminic acid mutarotase
MYSAIYCFQPETEQWSEVPLDAIAGTEHFDVAVLGSHLFFIGIDEEDHEGDRESVSCKYDGKDWSSIEYPECDVVNGFALAPFDTCLYIIGGHDYDGVDNPMYMNTVQRYDPILDRWFDVPGLQKARAHCKAVELNGMLHVFGGEDWSGSLADSECMTPKGWVPSPIKLPERTCEFTLLSVFE